MGAGADLIAALDAALAQAGSDIVLRRVFGQGASTLNSDVTVRAKALPLYLRQADQGGEQRVNSRYVISPTQIKAKGWPGGDLPSDVRPIRRLPARGDKVIIAGRERSIEKVDTDPFLIDGEIVRIEFDVLG